MGWKWDVLIVSMKKYEGRGVGGTFDIRLCDDKKVSQMVLETHR